MALNSIEEKYEKMNKEIPKSMEKYTGPPPSSDINCIDCNEHINNCPLCSNYYKNNTYIYVIIICVLVAIIILLSLKIFFK
jgi:hypothetical protein